MKKIKILFTAAEAKPYFMVGGLGDVAHSLPKALNSISQLNSEEIQTEVILVLPLHGVFDRSKFDIDFEFRYPLEYRCNSEEVEVYSTVSENLKVFFLESERISSHPEVYSSDPGIDGDKYIFFSLAVLEFSRILGWQPDIFHANDWHTASSICHLSSIRETDQFFASISTVLGIHNLPYLGTGAEAYFCSARFNSNNAKYLPKWAQKIPLPQGIASADHLVFPSPTYAEEVMTPAFGSGLHRLLKMREQDISGILNGIDYEIWDPMHDPTLTQPFNFMNLDDRLVNKHALQQQLNLTPKQNTILFGIVSRLDNQKGVDLLPGALQSIKDLDWQLVILGTGDPFIESEIRNLEEKYPDTVRTIVRFDAEMSRKIYAGADAFLIPSKYEPCGLTQMIAMRYGCVPIARATGGLKDTILDHRADSNGWGLLFEKPSSNALGEVMKSAINLFGEPAIWRTLQLNGMQQDYSWTTSARKYLSLYNGLIENRKLHTTITNL